MSIGNIELIVVVVQEKTLQGKGGVEEEMGGIY